MSRLPVVPLLLAASLAGLPAPSLAQSPLLEATLYELDEQGSFIQSEGEEYSRVGIDLSVPVGETGILMVHCSMTPSQRTAAGTMMLLTYPFLAAVENTTMAALVDPNATFEVDAGSLGVELGVPPGRFAAYLASALALGPQSPTLGIASTNGTKTRFTPPTGWHTSTVPAYDERAVWPEYPGTAWLGSGTGIEHVDLEQLADASFCQLLATTRQPIDPDALARLRELTGQEYEIDVVLQLVTVDHVLPLTTTPPQKPKIKAVPPVYIRKRSIVGPDFGPRLSTEGPWPLIPYVYQQNCWIHVAEMGRHFVVDCDPMPPSEMLADLVVVYINNLGTFMAPIVATSPDDEFDPVTNPYYGPNSLVFSVPTLEAVNLPPLGIPAAGQSWVVYPPTVTVIETVIGSQAGGLIPTVFIDPIPDLVYPPLDD